MISNDPGGNAATPRCFLKRANGIRISGQQAPGEVIGELPDSKEQGLTDVSLPMVLVDDELRDPGHDAVIRNLCLYGDGVSDYFVVESRVSETRLIN